MPTYPLAYLLTFTSYGTRLHGHLDGSVTVRVNEPGTPRLDANSDLMAENENRMKYPSCLLNSADRAVVLEAICQTCAFRNWDLLTAHVRSTHVHAVVQALTEPERILHGMKSYSSRSLNGLNPYLHRAHRWTRHGSTRYLWNHSDVLAALDYVINQQGRPLALYVSQAAQLPASRNCGLGLAALPPLHDCRSSLSGLSHCPPLHDCRGSPSGPKQV